MEPMQGGTTSHYIKLFLLLESRLLREALAGILRKQTDICLVGGSRYEPPVLPAILETNCDVLLSDQPTARGFPSDFITSITAARPQAKVVLVGMEDDTEIFLQAVRSGVTGYLLEDASADDTLAAVRRVARGEAVCPAHLCLQLFRFVAKIAHEGPMVLNQRLCNRLGLTSRQQQLVALLARGLTNKEIAVNLNLSEFTVRNHVHRIMRQLKVKNRQAAVETACEGNLTALLQPERQTVWRPAAPEVTMLAKRRVGNEKASGAD